MTGTRPALSDEAAPQLWPEKPRVTRAGLSCGCSPGVSRGWLLCRWLRQTGGLLTYGGLHLTVASTQKPKLLHELMAS